MTLCSIGWHRWERGAEIGSSRLCEKCGQWLALSDSALVLLCEIAKSMYFWMLAVLFISPIILTKDQLKMVLGGMMLVVMAVLACWIIERMRK